MRRNAILSGLVAVLLIALYYVLLFQPTRDDIATAQENIVAIEADQQALEAEITRLEFVRENATEAEASLAAARSIVPESSAPQPLLRQVQLAADESGVRVETFTLGRAEVSPFDPTLAPLGLSMQVEGGYFQVVDFLRRLEHPGITPRGIIWDSASVTIADYPGLSVSLTGRTFADADGAIPVDPQAPEALEAESEADITDADDEAVEGSVPEEGLVEDEQGEEERR